MVHVRVREHDRVNIRRFKAAFCETVDDVFFLDEAEMLQDAILYRRREVLRILRQPSLSNESRKPDPMKDDRE
jgi:hypothetical protein